MCSVLGEGGQKADLADRAGSKMPTMAKKLGGMTQQSNWPEAECHTS